MCQAASSALVPGEQEGCGPCLLGWEPDEDTSYEMCFEGKTGEQWERKVET